MTVYAQWIIWILHTHPRQAVKTHAGMDFSYGEGERGRAEENEREEEKIGEGERHREEEERARERQWSDAGSQENISCTV